MRIVAHDQTRTSGEEILTFRMLFSMISLLSHIDSARGER